VTLPSKAADDARSSAPRRRGRPPIISEAAVVDAALRVTERVGLDNLTMRLVAEELGMSMMAAYNYVPTKQALMELVAESVLARVEVPDRAAGPWDERLKTLGREVRETFRRYPGVVDALRVVHAEDDSTRLARGVMDILQDAGFDREQALLALVTFYKYMIGQVRFDDFKTPVVPRPRVAMDADELFEFGLETLLEGLRSRRRQLARSRRAD
jgi:TetR/AcrR family tetracycline transcriptional repressor